MDRKCILCDKALLPDNHAEHVIPNSIGGRLKNPFVICSTCNAEKGTTSDKRFADFFNPLCVHFQISRERNESPDSTILLSDGKKLRKSIDGILTLDRPIYHEVEMGEGKRRIIAQASNKKMLKQILGKVKTKDPTFNIDDAVAKANSTPEELDEFVSFGLTPPKEGFDDTIITACLALASFYNVDLSNTRDVIDFLNGQNNESFCGLFYSRDLLQERPSDRIFHCVGVSSQNENNMLIGYFEIFNCFRYLVKLADSYPDDSININYSINPVSGEELDLNLRFNISKSELEYCLGQTEDQTENLCNAAQTLFSIGAPKLNQEEYLNAIVRTADRKSKAACGLIDPEAPISQDDLLRYSRILVPSHPWDTNLK